MPAALSWSAVAVADHADALFEAERALAGRFVPRRMRTFASGRLAARRALAAAGCPPAAILMQPDGAPAAPEGWRLSISHTDETAVAVACRSGAAGGVGIDVEQIARMDPALRHYVVGPLDRVPGDADAERLTATFSLRESLFKAVPGVDPQALYVRWDGDAVDCGVEGEALALSYGWSAVDGHIVSYCVALFPGGGMKGRAPR
ncbi:MAG TPA: hypothetical protein VL460_05095 [Caulobacteraceae bacterium]|nr:hypothetical protein [Caulobacteraceae bacterium]